MPQRRRPCRRSRARRARAPSLDVLDVDLGLDRHARLAGPARRAGGGWGRRGRSWRRAGSAATSARRSIVIARAQARRIGADVDELVAHHGPHVEARVVDRQRDHRRPRAALRAPSSAASAELSPSMRTRTSGAAAELGDESMPGSSRARPQGAEASPCRRAARAPPRPTRARRRRRRGRPRRAGAASCPASVGTSPRPTRWKSRTPSSASSRRTCSLTDGWARWSSSAAALNEPAAGGSRKYSSCWRFISSQGYAFGYSRTSRLPPLPEAYLALIIQSVVRKRHDTRNRLNRELCSPPSRPPPRSRCATASTRASIAATGSG